MKSALPPLKIVIAGPVGAGKSTFIRSVSETPVVSTEEHATERIRKQTTTVAMDFGTIAFDDQPIHLFGTPGQDRFEFMWEILCEGATGLVFLVAGDRPGHFQNARHILEFITSRFPIPFVICVTRQDAARTWSAREVAKFFQIDPALAMGMDARSGKDCQKALYHIFELLNQKGEGDS